MEVLEKADKSLTWQRFFQAWKGRKIPETPAIHGWSATGAK